jgi:hypothetical protein
VLTDSMHVSREQESLVVMQVRLSEARISRIVKPHPRLEYVEMERHGRSAAQSRYINLIRTGRSVVNAKYLV